MATDDRSIDRKANTEGEAVDGDARPDFDHFDGFRDAGSNLRDRIPTLPRPDVSAMGVVMATLYAFVVTGALSVGYGATSLAAVHGGTYVALIVAGVFVFGYGYVGLQVIATATGGDA